MAVAAGGFVTRAFEAMLKECSANRGKFAALQQSIKSYLGAAAQEPQQEENGAPAPVTQGLASARCELEGTQDELVLQPALPSRPSTSSLSSPRSTISMQ